MDNKFKPVSRPAYGNTQSNQGYSRPVSYNKNQQNPTPPPEYPQQPTNETLGFQQEDYPSYPQPKRFNKKILFIILGVIVIVIGIVAFIFTKGGNNISKVDNVLENETQVGETSSLLGDTATISGFNGSAVEVPWPSDITPTKMEINLDPLTGDPVLMLVGEKSGVGTVIRSYNKAGSLTGFWVIVSSDPAMSDNTATNNTNATAGTNNTVAGTTPTLQQTIADEVYTYLGTANIAGMTTDQIIRQYNAQLSATATKYGKTVEDVLGYYLTATGLSTAG